MNVTKFLNSPDVAEHFKEHFHPEEYDDLTLRYAYLIDQSRVVGLREKHRAWREVMQTMSDSVFTAADGTEKSLFSALNDWIEKEEALLCSFCEGDASTHWTYQTRIYAKKGLRGVHNRLNHTNFPTLSACLSAAKEECTDEGVLGFRVEKHWADQKGSGDVALYGSDLEDVRVFVAAGEEFPRERRVLETFFHEFEIGEKTFPTPFSRGDVICFCHGGFVEDIDAVLLLNEKGAFGLSDCVEVSDRYRVKVYHENSLLNYRYFRAPLEGGERFLPVLADFLKGKLSIDVLFSVYRHRLFEALSEDQRECLEREHRNEGLERYGYAPKFPNDCV